MSFFDSFSRLEQISSRMWVGLSQVENYRVGRNSEDYYLRWQEAKDIWIANDVPDFLVRFEANRLFYGELLKSKGLSPYFIFKNVLHFFTKDYQHLLDLDFYQFSAAVKARKFSLEFDFFDEKKLADLDGEIFRLGLSLGRYDDAYRFSRRLGADEVYSNCLIYLDKNLQNADIFRVDYFAELFQIPESEVKISAFKAFHFNFNNENYSNASVLAQMFHLPDLYYEAAVTAAYKQAYGSQEFFDGHDLD